MSALNVDNKKGFIYAVEALAAMHGVSPVHKLRNVDLIVDDNQATVRRHL